MERNRGGRPRHPDVLTPAEWRVLEALREGGTNAEIAARLGLSLDTVKYHISNMLSKLELRDRRALAAWRPEERRGPLRAVFAVPAALAAIAKPLAWVGIGTVAAAGVAAAVVAVVAAVGVLLVVGGRDGGPVVTTTQTAVSPGPGPCTVPTDPTCIEAVYLGSPGDYAEVADIPADVLLTPGSEGRYTVQRGQQVTVVTAASLPVGWTRFHLERDPPGTPSPTSFEELIQPGGTTYTFTVADGPAGAGLITYDLTAARPNPRRPQDRPELGDVVVRTQFIAPKLTYHRLDVTGAADTPGSYAFLQSVGNPASAIDNFGFLPSFGVELLVHSTDAAGASQAELYDEVRVGDRFDFQTNGLRCGFRFEVTSVSGTTNPRKFGIQKTHRYGQNCGGLVDDPSVAQAVDFIWRPAPGVEHASGVRELLEGEPAGPGTYRVSWSLPLIIDVPTGMQVILGPVTLSMSTDDTPSRYNVTLSDAETGSKLIINGMTGEEILRSTASPAVDALFDQIVASAWTAE